MMINMNKMMSMKVLNGAMNGAVNGAVKAMKQPAAVAAFSTVTKTGYDEYWMPFTHNRGYKSKPKLLHRAEGMHYYLEDGTKILDGSSGLWCVNAGHGNKKIVEAIQKQAGKLDYASSFNIGHQLPFDFARKLLELVPNRGYGQVFFTMCGSTAVDTSLKIALAYHRARGNGTKTRFIGRERGYHGVGFGGISVGGISPNKKIYNGALLPNVDHLPHTHSYKDMAFSKGQPEWGTHLADELERLVTLHDASTIAAVIVEPVAGSTGVLVPPVGYLEKLQQICNKHDILLIFDEVITGFGRLGSSMAVEKFNVTPDMITCAKGMTNAAVPAGAVICHKKLYDGIMENAEREGAGTTIELFHGYTYGGHPLAMAAGIATLEVYEEEGLFQRAADMAPYFEKGLHSLKGLPNVVDIRNIGMMGAVELQPVAGELMKRSFDVFNRCFDKGVMVRVSGSTCAYSPPLICEKSHVDQMINTLHDSIIASAKEM
jgi:beta-alanine--pyruvate transaminase